MSHPIILASASPRRQELLKQICISCEVMPSQIDEHVHEDEHPLNYVRRIAAEKAMAITPQAPGRLVLGADTAVVRDSQIFGKPADHDDFIDMFSQLSGQSHQVISAVCLMRGQDGSIMVSVSDVEFREIGEQEMQDYWASGEPRDKAGGYGIQGLGAMFIKKISGSYSGIMGLPLFETAELLREAGVPLLSGKSA